MVKKAFSVAALAACLSAAVPAMAGFVATSGFDTIYNTDNGAAGASVQTPPDSFSVPNGTFAAYVPDGPSDPQIQGDLGNYGYSLNCNVVSVSAPATVGYSGTYEIYYNYMGQQQVSFGTVLLTANFTPGTNDAIVTGTLTQTAGPSGPYAASFTDLGADYGNHPVEFTGTYTGGTVDPSTGVIQGTLVQTTLLPEPASLSLALLGGTGLMFGRNRRQQKA